MKALVNQVYTSVACNRTPEIVDWNSEGLICYGASNAVVIYNTFLKGKDPLTVLGHHKSRVISVKWLRKSDGSSTEFISSSDDKTAAIWTLTNGVWSVTSSLIGHTFGVTCVGGVYTEDDMLTAFTSSPDATVRVWERVNGTVNLKQTISLSSCICLTLHVHLLPSINKPVLFCAQDDHKIHVYAGDDEYHKVNVLVGHEDWVRGLDVLNVDDSTILIASASQDTYIRLWRIQRHINEEIDSGIKVEQKLFTAYGEQWSVKLDAVLAGHEGWVYGVQWHPRRPDNQPIYRLLSSSLDKTLIVWEPETSPSQSEGEGVWVERVRVGEVGGNGLGFYGSRFGPDGKQFLGHGYNGSFHIWRLNLETRQWSPTVVCGGHFDSVEDVRWEPRGRYLMSVSSDQTTRVHAPWIYEHGTEWHEIARPQVHGYDMSSLALVSSTCFASSAEEKVIRVFEAPHNFVTNFTNIVGEKLVENGGVSGPEGASVPSLGLSNKAVFSGDERDSNTEVDGYFVPMELTEPPTEEILMQNTLWVESHKLYGHGYEVFCLDASSDGTLLASACKATVAEHAAVVIWETKNWHQIQKLVSHRLTVTQLAFSPDSQHLLSVSRDRRWTLYRRQQGSNSFSIAASTDQTNVVHTRIVWCCAWTHDSSVFGTGSRDGKICLWSKSDTESQSSLCNYALLGKPLELTTAVTSLSFAPCNKGDFRIAAAGLDNGVIRIYSVGVASGWEMLQELDNGAAHHLTVKRLIFSPKVEDKGRNKQMLLASCGADNFVRIHSVTVAL